MNFKTRKFIATLICILFSYALLATCIDVVVFDRNFYTQTYTKLNTAENMGVSEIGLYEATDTLLDYLKDYRDDIYVEIEVNGIKRAVYDERETTHMVDVKNLYLSVMFLRNVSIVVILALLGMLIYDDKKGSVSILTYTYKRYFLFFALFLASLITYAVCDFDTFWYFFHTIFFANDLWLLDPRISLMINMFPSPFFYAMVLKIALSFMGIMLFLYFYSLYDQRKRAKQELVI